MLSTFDGIAGATQLPAGVALVSVASCKDARGRLFALEQPSPVPFSPVRTFVIRDVPPGQARGHHAQSCHEFLWLLSGSCVATVHDGRTRATIHLRAEEHALTMAPGVWIGLGDFEHGTVLLVLASKRYSETQSFSEPQPALIAAHTQRS